MRSDITTPEESAARGARSARNMQYRESAERQGTQRYFSTMQVESGSAGALAGDGPPHDRLVVAHGTSVRPLLSRDKKSRDGSAMSSNGNVEAGVPLP